jgi:hypothetical protein
VILPRKSPVEQTQEVERLVSDALEKLDQVRYALTALESRLKEQAEPPDGDDG